MFDCVYQSTKVLDEEENADKQLRASHGARWTRTPSERLTESIRAEAARYRQIIDNAVNADSIVRQRYAEHREGFELLSRSDVSVHYALQPGVYVMNVPISVFPLSCTRAQPCRS